MNNPDKSKQVIVIRKDLKMRKGKMVSQGSHSSLKAIIDIGYIQSDEHGNPCLIIPLEPEVESWVTGIFTKICVGVDSFTNKQKTQT